MTMLSKRIAQSDRASVQECVIWNVTVLRFDEYVFIDPYEFNLQLCLFYAQANLICMCIVLLKTPSFKIMP